MDSRIRKMTLAYLAVAWLAGILHPSCGAAAVRGKGHYTKMETRFELPGIQGNPFDFTENDVLVTIETPDGTARRIPAFYDGGVLWRVRFTPDRPGRYRIARITRNGREVRPEKIGEREFDVAGKPGPGFIRRDPRFRTRFLFGNGEPYYPIGHNVAWGSGKPGDIAGMFGKMGKAGENWSRVWMNHWDGKDLDWVMGKKLEPGTLDLNVAKRWDEIVEAAESNGIYFQMTLQHHGQYSSRVNPNWDENPWNAKNGGFLSAPEEFFTHPRARALTRAKYRYILARWGYSPHIMAWELFNEVEWTDAIRLKREETVADWHREMAAFLRRHDPFDHLVTTSSDRGIPGLYDVMDYLQPHAYPQDALPAVTSLNGLQTDRPIFFGEIGPGGAALERDDGTFLRRSLWASLMTEAGGAAQYWAWDVVERRDLYGLFTPAVEFVRQSGVLSKPGLAAIPVGVETEEIGPLVVSPGAGWEAAERTEFTVLPSGVPGGAGLIPAYLQGDANRKMFPAATFHVDYPKAGTFAVTVSQSSRAGGRVVLSLGGKEVAEKAFPAAERDTRQNETLEIEVPAGAHEVRVENTGADWVVLSRITLNPYAPQLGVLGKGGNDFAALWIYRRGEADSGIQGKLSVPGLRSGVYKVTWWDTIAGKTHSETRATVSGGALTLETTAVSRDLAAFVTRLKD